MLDFAFHLALEQGEMNDQWEARLAEVGFTTEDMWDIGAIAAFFGMSNRMVNLTGTPPNEEFYLMGRVPRQ